MEKQNAEPGQRLAEDAVQHPRAEFAGNAPPGRASKRRGALLVACGLAAALALGVFWVMQRSREPEPDKPRLVAQSSQSSQSSPASASASPSVDATSTASSGSSGSADPAIDTQAIKAQLDAIESELASLSLPADTDFDDAESALQ